MKLVAAISLATLAACSLPTASNPVANPQSYVVSEAPIPFAVSRLLPRSVTARDVRVDQNCYGYEYQGQIYPVLIPRGTQYCL